MANTYEWVIEQMTSYPQYDGETDVVFSVNWRLNGTDGNGHNGTVYGSVGVTYDAGSTFTPYDQLTQDQVVGWVIEVLGQEDIDANKLSIDNQINEQISPSAVILPLPWN